MMTIEKAGALLLQRMTEGLTDAGRDLVFKSALKLKPRSEETTLPCTMEQGRAALEACGTLLSDDTEPGETVGYIMAGFRDRNPAVVELCEDGGEIRARATAKEGVIPQSTAKKALDKLRAAL